MVKADIDLILVFQTVCFSGYITDADMNKYEELCYNFFLSDLTNRSFSRFKY